MKGVEIGVLSNLGVHVHKNQNIGSPCPMCGGTDRFSWYLKGKSEWRYRCRHCSPRGGDAFDLITKINDGDAVATSSQVVGVLGLEPIEPINYAQVVAVDEKERAKAVILAKKINRTLLSRDDHKYLESRGLNGVRVPCLSASQQSGGIDFPSGSICLPMTDGSEIVNVQLINESGQKCYLKGGKKQGCYHLLNGTNPTRIFMAEGLATALSVHRAFDGKEPVVVCFDSGNLSHVAGKIRELHARGFFSNVEISTVEELPMVFMADKDLSKAGMNGASNAVQPNDHVHLPPIDIPEGQKSVDWDDYRQKGGDIAQAVLDLENPVANEPEFTPPPPMGSFTPPPMPVTNENKPNGKGRTFIDYPDLRDDNKPLGTYDNVKALVEGLGLKPAHNTMNLELEMLKDNKPLDLSYEAKRSMLISEALKSWLPKSAIEDHMNALSENANYHPVKAWLDNGEWDGVERVEKVIDALNAKDKALASIGMNKWFVACVAALYEKNFTCKLVPILQGDQSYMKTAFISRFADVVPCSFLEGAELNPDNKDSILSCIKSWIVELGELERTSKNSQGSLKAFITKNVDSVRPPYGRSDVKKKRQTVFIASVNGSEFLRDDTGSSRYAVIELAKAIDMDSVNEILGWTYKDGRVQLVDENKLRQFWLEVKHNYDTGGSWMLSTKELSLFDKINTEHKFKSNWRFELEEKFLDVDMNTRSMEWMKASEVCAYCDFPKGKSREIGKALASMVKDGLIVSEKKSRNVTKYHLPTLNEFNQ
ncbi:VapE domain-containing protein [Vibrio gallicus]|uniref:VapE domain-containing protein n=1 Tax=Vibrio gallicus TaxID=190897 RepID=UPI0021C33202|nr:VapE domain-containing protein [Vibrio gallicus]